MSGFPNNLSVDKNWLYQLAAELPLSKSATKTALDRMGVLPDHDDWRNWLMLIAFGLGAALFLAGVIFFFAYNWESLHRFERFAAIGAGVIVSAVAAFFSGLEKFSGKLWLTVASVLTGVLLATFGMVYQTGADSYKLFASWAVLITPWVFVSRFQPLWLIWLLLVNAAISRWILVAQPGFMGLFFHTDDLLEMLVPIPLAINMIVLILREKTTLIHTEPETGRWLPRLIALSLLGALTPVPIMGIFEAGGGTLWTFLLVTYFVTLIVMIYFYLRVRQDLVILTLTVISIIVVLTSAFIKMLFTEVADIGSVFLVGLFILAETTVATKILLALHRKWSNEGADE